MKIAFYLEPVIFRGTPAFLTPHVHWFLAILDALAISRDDSVTLMTNRALADVFGQRFAGKFDAALDIVPLDPGLALDASGGSVRHYARDLYDRPDAPVKNAYLDRAIRDGLARAGADIVICSSENRYLLRHRSALSPQFFIEQSPLPSGMRGGLYFDPFGHQAHSVLRQHWRDILTASYRRDELEKGAGVIEELERRKEAARSVSGPHRAAGFADPARDTVMVALQPDDWLSWEGALRTCDRPLDLLLRVARSLPGHTILPTFHKDMQPTGAALRGLRALSPNIAGLGQEECTDSSEDLLPLLDNVYTVSSSVGITALLYGCTLVSDADSYLSSAAVTTEQFLAGHRPRLLHDERVRLAAFLKARYNRPISGMTSLGEYRQQRQGIIDAVSRGPDIATPHYRSRPDAKFGVLDFSYAVYAHFRAAHVAGRPYTINLGDYVQSLGVWRALRALGIADRDIVPVDRDSLGAYDGPPVNLVMNGVFTASNFPLSPAINPVFFGFSYHPDNMIPSDDKALFEPSLTHLEGRRIWCRDKATAERLEGYGLDTRISGCLSQSFAPGANIDRRHLPVLLCGLDDPQAESHLKALFPGHVRLKDQRRPVAVHPLPPAARAECRAAAGALLGYYERHFSMVVTSLMHCASPCASLGIPTVIIRRDPDNLRFSDLKAELPVIGAENVLALGEKELRGMAKTLARRQSLLAMLGTALARATARETA